MLLVKLWNFLRGYVIINVNGYFIEKFINLCTSKGIYLWDIKKKVNNNMTLKLSIKGFKELKGIVKKTRCKIKIIKKVGFPFIKFRYRKRKTFLIGFVVFIGILYFLMSFIWIIEINGVEKVNPQTIINFLDKSGIKPGIFKFNVDKETLVPKLLIEVDQISWADLRIEGTKFVLNVKERLEKVETVDTTIPCNIYAKKSGVVLSVIAKNGKAIVKEGSVVQKGQMLISGIIENRFYPEQPRIVHSDGEVKAVTWYEDSAEVSIEQIKRERTGAYKTGFGIKLFGKYYGLFGDNVPFKIVDKDEKSLRLAITKNNLLPLELVTKKYYEVKCKTYLLTEQQAKQKAKSNVYKKIQESLSKDIEVVDKKVEFENIGNTIKANGMFQCIESIGYKEKITND